MAFVVALLGVRKSVSDKSERKSSTVRTPPLVRPPVPFHRCHHRQLIIQYIGRRAEEKQNYPGSTSTHTALSSSIFLLCASPLLTNTPSCFLLCGISQRGYECLIAPARTRSKEGRTTTIILMLKPRATTLAAPVLLEDHCPLMKHVRML